MVNASKLDVKGSFMYALLPDDTVIVVRPPKLWVVMGVVAPDPLWTLRKAVYGLRCAPRCWAIYRDGQLRKMSWKVGNDEHYIVQCSSDDQFWMLRKRGSGVLLGLV